VAQACAKRLNFFESWAEAVAFGLDVVPVLEVQQKRSLVPKYRTSLSAVSVLMRRLPWTISLIVAVKRRWAPPGDAG
jgi:hypothetical protein